jgi:hypothetical protein
LTAAVIALAWAGSKPRAERRSEQLAGVNSQQKGDSVITCTITDDSGNVVETQTGRGAYASCFASTSSVILTN